MHLIVQVRPPTMPSRSKTISRWPCTSQGEVVDIAFRERTMDTVRDWCKQASATWVCWSA